MNRRRFLQISTLGSAGLVTHVLLNRCSKQKIKLYFNFDSHSTKDEAVRVGELAEKFKPHAVVLESDFESEEQGKILEENFFDMRQDQAYNEQLRQVLSVQRPQIIIAERFDREDATTFKQRVRHALQLMHGAAAQFLAGRPQDALNIYRTAIEEQSALHEIREKNAKNTIDNLYNLLIAKAPQLKNETELRILVNYGNLHTALYKHARKTTAKVKRQIKTPTYLPSLHALIRRRLFGLKPPKERQLIGGLLSDIIYAYGLNHLALSPTNRAALANILTNKLTVSQFHTLSRRTLQKSNAHGNEDLAFKMALAEQKIKLPESKAEALAFLNKKIGPRLVDIEETPKNEN